MYSVLRLFPGIRVCVRKMCSSVTYVPPPPLPSLPSPFLLSECLRDEGWRVLVWVAWKRSASTQSERERLCCDSVWFFLLPSSCPCLVCVCMCVLSPLSPPPQEDAPKSNSKNQNLFPPSSLLLPSMHTHTHTPLHYHPYIPTHIHTEIYTDRRRAHFPYFSRYR